MFKISSKFSPQGDQPKAIAALTSGIEKNRQAQVLLGITGSGKTFTMANVIASCNRPTLVLAHNKTLAAQLYQEFKQFFPENAVEYFISYYDYYQPEAYIARSDTYIEKDMSINDRIDKMRLSATRSLIERRDVIIVASVSCIYGLGTPAFYQRMQVCLSLNQHYPFKTLLADLVAGQYARTTGDLKRGHFRDRGDILEIMPAYEESIAYRIEHFDNTIEKITKIDPQSGNSLSTEGQITIFPSSHHVTPKEIIEKAIASIEEELRVRCDELTKENKHTEKIRLTQRTQHDIAMIRETGSCKGIENYSLHFSERPSGSPPDTLLDYFPKDFLLFVDESHQTIPQIHAMYAGDHARKKSLVEFGFRLPSAFDNRPLTFEEFYERIGQVIFVSATPGQWEIHESHNEIIEQIIRPTGLLDPIIQLKKAKHQVDDCIKVVREEIKNTGKVLITVLTKKLAEELAQHFLKLGIRAKYLHSDIETEERVHIINDLRNNLCDVLIGINLLREGLDIPEVSLVLILDADKEGFLRSETALIQTCGRAARNVNGHVIMYGDKKTAAIKNTMAITEWRRAQQKMHNEKHHITPTSAQRAPTQNLLETFGLDYQKSQNMQTLEGLTAKEILAFVEQYKKQMLQSSSEENFAEAARLRNLMLAYEEKYHQLKALEK